MKAAWAVAWVSVWAVLAAGAPTKHSDTSTGQLVQASVFSLTSSYPEAFSAVPSTSHSRRLPKATPVTRVPRTAIPLSFTPTGLPGKPIQALSHNSPLSSLSPSIAPPYYTDELAALENLIKASSLNGGVPLDLPSQGYQDDTGGFGGKLGLSEHFQGSLGDSLPLRGLDGLHGDARGYGSPPLISGDSQTIPSGDIFNFNSGNLQGVQGGSSIASASGVQGRNFGGLDLGIDLEGQALDPAALLAADLLRNVGGLQGGAGSLDGLQLNSEDLSALEGGSDVYDLLQSASRRFSRSHTGSDSLDGLQFNSGHFSGFQGDSGGYSQLREFSSGGPHIEKVEGIRLGSADLDDLDFNLGDQELNLGDLHLDTAGFTAAHLTSSDLGGLSLPSDELNREDLSVGSLGGSGQNQGALIRASGVSSSTGDGANTFGVSLTNAVQGLSGTQEGSFDSIGSISGGSVGGSGSFNIAGSIRGFDNNDNNGGFNIASSIEDFDSVESDGGFDIVGSIGGLDSVDGNGGFDRGGGFGVSLADAVQGSSNVNVGGIGSVDVSLTDALNGLSGTSTSGGGSFGVSLADAVQGGSGAGVSVGVGVNLGGSSSIGSVGVSLSDVAQDSQLSPNPTAASGTISSSTFDALDSLGELLTDNQSDITNPDQSLGSFLRDINGKNGVMVLPGSSLDAVTNGQLSTAEAADASLRTNFEVSSEVNDNGNIEVDIDTSTNDDDDFSPGLATVLSTNTGENNLASSGDSLFVSTSDSSITTTTPSFTTATTTTTEGPPRLARLLPNLLFSKGQFFGTLLGGLQEIGTTILKAITETDWSAPPPRRTYGES